MASNDTHVIQTWINGAWVNTSYSGRDDAIERARRYRITGARNRVYNVQTGYIALDDGASKATHEV